MGQSQFAAGGKKNSMWPILLIKHELQDSYLYPPDHGSSRHIGPLQADVFGGGQNDCNLLFCLLTKNSY